MELPNQRQHAVLWLVGCKGVPCNQPIGAPMGLCPQRLGWLLPPFLVSELEGPASWDLHPLGVVGVYAK